MAEEGRGVALAILGIIAVIAVVGLVLLFTGATGKVSAPSKIYGGALRGEEFPYLTDRTTGGHYSTASDPPLDAGYMPAGAYAEKPVPLELQEDAGFYGETIAGERLTSNRQPYYVPSGQICPTPDGTPGFRCPQNTYCIPDPSEVEGTNWEYVVGPCARRIS